MKRGWLVLLVFLILLSYSISVSSQINSEIKDLFGDNEEAEVIVVLKDDYNVLSEYGIKSYSYKDDFEMKKMMIEEQQENVLSGLKLKKKGKGVSIQAIQADEEHEFDLTNTYTTVNGFAGKLKKSSYEKLKNNPRVLKIEKDLPVKVALDKSREHINATNVWRLIYNGINITGRGESICVIDSGVDYTHPALGNCTLTNFTNGNCKVVGGYDFENEDNDPMDDNGHGTYVAGIIASTDLTYRGIAPESTIVAIKSLNSSGIGLTSKIVAGIDWCVNNASKLNISVISLSLGTTILFSNHCDSASSSYTNAIANAIKNNISVVAATGNDGDNTGIVLPACITNVTSVGSVGDTDSISIYSNRNAITDLLAPGGAATSNDNIKSTVPTGTCELCHSSGFLGASGTSAATPHVSAAFALLRQYRRLEQNIILTPAQIQDTLNDTGKQINDTSGSGFFFSRINVFSALLSIDTNAPNITFVEPTPANNTKTPKNSLFINITSNEVLSIALLEFNGTNETMQGSGLNWFKNKTVPSNQNAAYTYKIWGNDSAGNIANTDFRVFISNNTPPSILSFAPAEFNFSLAESNSNFTFNITISDVDNDSSIIWHQNLSIKATNSNFTFQNNFSAAGFYNITVHVFDDNFTTSIIWSLTVNNTNRAANITSFSPNEANLNIAEPNNQAFNITYSDSDSADNITITWHQNGTNKSSSPNFAFIGNSTAAGFYNITVIVSDGTNSTSQSWNLTVFNPAPNITSVNLTNTDYLNRTNGTLQAFFSFTDSDNDAITANETLWYINNTFITDYTNKTSIHPINTTKLENWTFSVRVFDNSSWSDFLNSSTTKILNANPSINITTLSINALETQLVNISLNASDLDDEQIKFTSNKSEFILSNNALLWHTNLTSSGTYTINLTVNDSLDIDSVIINVTIEDARDLDNDGNPDFNETDDDNDGINDTDDFLIGNLSSINTTIPISITIDGTSNFSKLFNGTFTINITNGSDLLVEFNFTFNSSNVLDLGNITFNRTARGFGGFSIRGSLNLFNSTKTIFLEKLNATAKAVCIKDANVGFDNISSACDAANETLLTCNNQSSGQYTCYDTGLRYKITGLNHSAVKEQCRDNDGDGYGDGCAAGSDNCDSNPSQHTSDGCNPPSSSSSSGGGGSGGGGGGGGSGGGGAFFVCNMDWKCTEWSACANGAEGAQTRQCEFVKIPQHAQETQCPELSKAPITSQTCQVKAEETPKTISTASTASAEIEEKANKADTSSDIGSANPIEETLPKKGILSSITGAAAGMSKSLNFSPKAVKELTTALIVISAIAVSGIFVYYRFFRSKHML